MNTGSKYIIPYGLYRCEGYVSANLARKTTGFSEEDLDLLWEAILNMFDHNHSAARGKMAVRELIIFQHDSELGCAPAWKLFESVKVERTDQESPARSYRDYQVTVDETALPAGVWPEMLFKSYRRPVHGAWIETGNPPSYTDLLYRRSPQGGVD